jgi:hypothetical protein
VSSTQIRRPFGKTLVAAWRHLCYKLAYHRFLSLSLKRWIWALVVLPPLVAWFGQLAWLWAVPLSVLGAAALVGAEGARRRQYILFAGSAPGDQAPATDPSVRSPHRPMPDSEESLAVDEPLRCWASGLLGVEGKKRALAGERASISFVRTREHVVMAQIRRTRFLLLAPVSKADVGYWYTFFYPHQVQSVHCGTLHCGFSARPGLELSFARGEAGQRVQLYLGFEDSGARQRLLDDLRRDVKVEAF